MIRLNPGVEGGIEEALLEEEEEEELQDQDQDLEGELLLDSREILLLSESDKSLSVRDQDQDQDQDQDRRGEIEARPIRVRYSRPASPLRTPVQVQDPNLERENQQQQQRNPELEKAERRVQDQVQDEYEDEERSPIGTRVTPLMRTPTAPSILAALPLSPLGVIPTLKPDPKY